MSEESANTGSPESTFVGILCLGTPSASDRRAIQIAEFLGLSVVLLPLDKISRGVRPRTWLGLIGSADTVSHFARSAGEQTQLMAELRTLTPEIFVYGFRADGGHDGLVKSLTGGACEGVGRSSSNEPFSVVESARDFTGQFSGLTLGMSNEAVDSSFLEMGGDWSTLIRAGDRPFLIRSESSDLRITLVACSELADLEESVGRDQSILDFFSRLVPLMMFLRNTFGDAVWENKNPRACFIIDDPLLTESYGFLNYRELVRSMEKIPFSASIAFIPYNYEKSERETAALFSSHSNELSLCVHGCDHTRGEFGSDDVNLLECRSRTALQRMAWHEQRAGVAFDRVMVFPQGIFSAAAVEALQAADYIAAINSTPYPVDMEGGIPLKDLLRVGINRFCNFALFVRRYPQNLATVAFDLFLGKQALLVEHHGFFRNGFGPIMEIVEKLRRMEPRLEWTNPERVCSTACLTKSAANGQSEILFFTDRFQLKNERSVEGDIVLRRRDTPERPALAVSINGRKVEFWNDKGFSTVCLRLAPGEVAEVIVHRQSGQAVPASGEKWAYRARVFVRRALSEIRDNYVDKNVWLSRMLSGTRRLLGRRLT